MTDFTVIKCDATGHQELSYAGTIRERGETYICVDAIFQFSDRDLGYIALCKGDVFTEWFYSDRWYNIFRVQDGKSGKLKGWYCNITRPATISQNQVSADDLALDVFVYPDGKTLLLDEDEFADLDLSDTDRKHAWDAVDQIKHLVENRLSPFDEVT